MNDTTADRLRGESRDQTHELARWVFRQVQRLARSLFLAQSSAAPRPFDFSLNGGPRVFRVTYRGGVVPAGGDLARFGLSNARTMAGVVLQAAAGSAGDAGRWDQWPLELAQVFGPPGRDDDAYLAALAVYMAIRPEHGHQADVGGSRFVITPAAREALSDDVLKLHERLTDAVAAVDWCLWDSRGLGGRPPTGRFVASRLAEDVTTTN